jgi:rhodanese-related sulfurtransferase
VKSIHKHSVKLLASVLFSAAVISYVTVKTESIEAQAAPFEISVQDFEKIYKANPKIALLDVRTSQEYKENHVTNAVLLDVNEIMQLGSKVQSKIPFPKDKVIYVICRSGNRSMTATKILRSQGYTQAVSVRGGTMAWDRIGNSCQTKFMTCAR